MPDILKELVNPEQEGSQSMGDLVLILVAEETRHALEQLLSEQILCHRSMLFTRTLAVLGFPFPLWPTL